MEKAEYDNILAVLTQLGLSKYSARIYLQLLELGLTTTGPIISATKLHRQFVYQALEQLVELKLATFVIKNNRKHFQAAPPEDLLLGIREKERLAREIIPNLIKFQQNDADRLEVRTLHGKSAFFENLCNTVESAKKSDKIVRIIGGASDRIFYETLGNDIADYRKLLDKYKVRKYLIAPADYSHLFKRRFVSEEGNILRTMPHGLSSPTYTRITHELVSIEIYAVEPTIVQIRNRAVAEGYLEHFELLWQEAKEYKKRNSSKTSKS